MKYALITRPGTISGIDPKKPMNVTLDGSLEYEDEDIYMTIDEGFSSDGGSIPRFAWTILGVTPTDPRCIYGFLLHDGGFQSHLLSWSKCNTILANVISIKPSPNALQQYAINKVVFLCSYPIYIGKTKKDMEYGRKYVHIRQKNKLRGTVIK